MTLEQVIEFCLHMSEEQYKSAHNTIIGDYPEYEAAPHFRLASEYKQIAEWLTEQKELRSLKTDYVFFKAEAKKLLKAAVEDINFYVDCYEAHCDECCCDHDNHCHWKHEAKALALIGGEADGI